MKKIEAKALAPEKSKLVIEYITQILSDSEKAGAPASSEGSGTDSPGH